MKHHFSIPPPQIPWQAPFYFGALGNVTILGGSQKWPHRVPEQKNHSQPDLLCALCWLRTRIWMETLLMGTDKGLCVPFGPK